MKKNNADKKSVVLAHTIRALDAAIAGAFYMHFKH
jgi:hypothetical protein